MKISKSDLIISNLSFVIGIEKVKQLGKSKRVLSDLCPRISVDTPKEKKEAGPVDYTSRQLKDNVCN